MGGRSLPPIYYGWNRNFLGEKNMIDVTRMNGTSITINSDLIEIVEETPDTVVTLTTGKKIIIKESRQDVKNLVKSFRRECYSFEE